MDPDDEPQELLASLARDLQDDASSGEAIDRVVDCAQVLVPAASSAGISVARRQQPPTTAAATDPVATRADELQVECGEGPCYDAAWADAVVTSRDLAHDDRWRAWSRRMVDDLGVRSLLCVRLFTHSDHLGALTLYAQEPEAFNTEAVDTALALAAHSAVAVAQAVQLEHLQTALDSRTVIGQAVGLVMRDHQLSSHDAFQLLTRLSSHQNRKVVTIAGELVTRHDREREAQKRFDRSVTAERTPPVPGPRDQRGRRASQ
ncbi:GAF and ANTAR domain-containing protein [Nocardioides marmoraquaticus]